MYYEFMTHSFVPGLKASSWSMCFVWNLNGGSWLLMEAHPLPLHPHNCSVLLLTWLDGVKGQRRDGREL